MPTSYKPVIGPPILGTLHTSTTNNRPLAPVTLWYSGGAWRLVPFFVSAIVALFCKHSNAEILAGVRWSSYADLTSIASVGLRVRYVVPNALLVTGDSSLVSRLQTLGFSPFVIDSCPDGEEYFLTDHVHLPLPSINLVYVHPDGWALLRVAASDFVAVHQQLHFLWPLPEEFRLSSYLRLAKAVESKSVLSPNAIANILDTVDPERLRRHVEFLSLLDPSNGSIYTNLRTRYARRPETWETTVYIRDQLAAVLGPQAVELQQFRPSAGDSTMYNVIGILNGTDPTLGYYVVCAHYDAIGVRTRGWDWRVDPAPGADDNATGTALVLESARVLSGHQFPWSIRFIAFSGEELGLWGSRAYATEAFARDDQILGVLNFDMIGFNHLRQRIELVTNTSSRWLVDQLVRANERYEIGMMVDVREDDFAGLSDHAPFWARGYDAILGIENYLPTDSTSAGVQQGNYRINRQYHQVVDVADSINWALVARTTRLAVATLAQYGVEEGLPNLAVFTGDVTSDSVDDLRLRISNLGRGRLQEPFRVRLWRCAPDSTDCRVVYDVQHNQVLEPGGGIDVGVSWARYGDMAFLIEVDPEDQIAELEEGDNSAFQHLRLIPRNGIVVFPNPFVADVDNYVSFSGLPFRARVRIYTLSGDLIWIGEEERQGILVGEIRWRGSNAGGFAVAEGVYIYVVTRVTGQLLDKGKIALVR